nr:hypothetical protein [Neobacillus sp. Marseille-Q6967]
MDQEKLIEVKLHGATAFFTNSELLLLLRFDKEIYGRALKRGKGILRARKQRKREFEKMEQNIKGDENGRKKI